MTFLFQPTISSLPVRDSKSVFPVRRIYCVGRNYADHAKEMGHSDREAPFFFTKPADAVVANPKSIDYPKVTSELHHEVELVIAIGEYNSSITLESAWDCVFGYALGVDLTKRDLQAQYKSKSRPWDLAKGFDQSAPISSIAPFSDFGKLESGKITLSVEGEVKQVGDINQMIWSIPEIIIELSKHIELKAGDLIFTGTPSGVGEIKKGQTIRAKLFDLSLDFKVN